MKSHAGILDPHRGSARTLDFLFAPRSIAVIGATDKEGSVGRSVLENLRSFGGSLHPINPNHETILGMQAFPSVEAAPAPIDLAVIATPAPTVPGIVRECGQAGVRGAVILSAGFRESGSEGSELERQIKEEAARGGVRILGPNCLGLMAPHAHLNATFAGALPQPGNIAFISQSGALCTAILGWSFRKKLGFSAFVSVGSMLDLGWGDLIDHLGSDPNTHSIVIYMESIGDARSFLSAAREVSFTKPIIVIKVGRTEAAATAVVSHTGAMAESDEVLDAAFRRVGVLRVDTIEDLFELAELVGKQPVPRGPRLCIVTNAGGPGALAADTLVARGGRLAQLTSASVAALDGFLPKAWSHGNPIDIQGDADEARFAKAVEVAVADPESDGVLVVLTPQALTNATTTAEALRPFANIHRKPVLASWMGGAEVDGGRRVLAECGIPVFEYPDTAARAFCYMWQRSSNLHSLYETPALSAFSTGGEGARKRAADVIRLAQRAGRTLLSEYEAKQVIAAYDLPTVETSLALSEKAAVAAAERMGYPVAVKLHSESLAHKTEVGGVHLDVGSRAGVRAAWRAIEKSVAEKAGKRHFLGVTVQRMASRTGYELLLGSSVDPNFGPVIVFGAGGELVNVFRDRALALPPLTANLARLAIEQTKIHAALLGVRGRLPADIRALELLLVRFSQLVAEHPRIKEIDINPLLVSSEQMIALDARIVLHDPSVKEQQLPRPSIRPYPFHYVRSETLKDGTPVTIRPIRAEDEPLMVRLHHHLSEDSVYNRYFSFLKLEQRIAHERLARLCFIDYDREMALVAEHTDPRSGEREIIGVGRLVKQPGTNSGEFAVLVDDRWQGRGLGSMLLRLVVRVGRDEHLSVVTGEILPDNVAMKSVARRVGFRLHQSAGDGVIRAVIEV
jgi:acetyltransferase